MHMVRGGFAVPVRWRTLPGCTRSEIGAISGCDWRVALGAQVTVPVLEFDKRCSAHAFRGVIVYVKLSIRCACASRVLVEVVFLCVCAPYWLPVGGRYAFQAGSRLAGVKALGKLMCLCASWVPGSWTSRACASVTLGVVAWLIYVDWHGRQGVVGVQ